MKKGSLQAKKKKHLLFNAGFPLCNKYDDEWVFENQMGPNVLWLTEWLAKDMKLKSGMKVLDMGCGKGLSSIMLAREFGVQVLANDLWIKAEDNLKRIKEAGLEGSVFPIHAEAHNLPYAENFFDAVVSIDSYQYYGTDELYMGYFHRFVKPGGKIGIVMPGYHENVTELPEYFKKRQKSGGTFFEWEMITFHNEEWWKKMWGYYPFIRLLKSETMENGGKLWLEWEIAQDKRGGERMFPSDAECLSKDDNKTVTFIKLICERVKAQQIC